jgi:hypothetical protein
LLSAGLRYALGRLAGPRASRLRAQPAVRRVWRAAQCRPVIVASLGPFGLAQAVDRKLSDRAFLLLLLLNATTARKTRRAARTPEVSRRGKAAVFQLMVCWAAWDARALATSAALRATAQIAVQHTSSLNTLYTDHPYLHQSRHAPAQRSSGRPRLLPRLGSPALPPSSVYFQRRPPLCTRVHLECPTMGRISHANSLSQKILLFLVIHHPKTC